MMAQLDIHKHSVEEIQRMIERCTRLNNVRTLVVGQD